MIAPFLPRSTAIRLSVPVNAREPERKPVEDESSGTGDTPSADSEKMEYEAAASAPVVLRPGPGGRMKAVTVAPGTAGSVRLDNVPKPDAALGSSA